MFEIKLKEVKDHEYDILNNMCRVLTPKCMCSRIGKQLILKCRCYFICDLNNNILGYILIVLKSFGELYVVALAVNPQFRLQGIGRSTVYNIIEIFNPYEISLHVNLNNCGALKFYETIGFQKIKEI